MRKLAHLVLCAALALSALTWAAAGPAQGAEKVKVAIVGSGPGAEAYRLAGALAAMLGERSKTVDMTNRVSKGFVANIRHVESGEAEFGMSHGPLLLEAMTATGAYKAKHVNLRGVGPVAMSWFHLVTYERQGIRKLSDLKGKRVNFGPKGSNSEWMTSHIFRWAGLYEGLQKNYLRWDDSAQALQDGKLDAFTIPSPIPVSSVVTAMTGGDIFLVPLPERIINEFIKLNPGFRKSPIPAGSYKGQKQAAETAAYTFYTFVHKDVPADVVYEVTRLNYDPANRVYLVRAQRSWAFGLDAAPDLAGMAAFGMKLHPGAERYWKEKGFTIPKEIAN